MKHKTDDPICVNQSAEQRARKVLPRRAKITKTQNKMSVKCEDNKRKKRERRRRDEKHQNNS